MRVATDHRSMPVPASVLVLFFSVASNAQTWRQVSPPGGDVQSLAAAAGNPRTLFPGGICRSSDAGRSWQLIDLEGLVVHDHAGLLQIPVFPNAEGELSALRARCRNQLVAALATEGFYVLDMNSASSASADAIPASPAAQQ